MTYNSTKVSCQRVSKVCLLSVLFSQLTQRYLKQLKKPDFINVKPTLLEGEYNTVVRGLKHKMQTE